MKMKMKLSAVQKQVLSKLEEDAARRLVVVYDGVNDVSITTPEETSVSRPLRLNDRRVSAKTVEALIKKGCLERDFDTDTGYRKLAHIKVYALSKMTWR